MTRRRRVCVLQPSYEGSSAAYGAFDPPRDLTALLPEDEVCHVFLRKATAYRQIRDAQRAGAEVFVNLCEGYLDWDIPSIDVIHALEALGAAYTGPTLALYDPTKRLMKRVAWYAGVATPRAVVAETMGDVARAAATLRFPLFVKPDRGGDSLGVDLASHCLDAAALAAKASAVMAEFGAVVIDEYVEGREFSVLVAAGTPTLALWPVEFRFGEGVGFKTYDLKITEYHPERNVACDDPVLAEALMGAARRVFEAFRGVGYCRMDFRVDAAGAVYFLDANFACSVFYPEGAYGTADYILQHSGFGAARFLAHIIDEAVARHRARQPAYEVFGDAVAGYGIRALRPLRAGEVVFRGEERAQRIVTRGHVARTWSAEAQEVFRRYAYPLSREVCVLWDENPEGWAPQNHSCEPNCGFVGLDMLAVRDVAAGEELTLDYTLFCDDGMEPFDCACGAASCRGRIVGVAGNSVDFRAGG